MLNFNFVVLYLIFSSSPYTVMNTYKLPSLQEKRRIKTQNKLYANLPSQLYAPELNEAHKNGCNSVNVFLLTQNFNLGLYF